MARKENAKGEPAEGVTRVGAVSQKESGRARNNTQVSSTAAMCPVLYQSRFFDSMLRGAQLDLSFGRSACIYLAVFSAVVSSHL